MSRRSGTRALKNATFISAVSPHLFPNGEPQAGYASVVPFEVLDRFHRMTDEELRPYPQLRQAAEALRRKQRAGNRKASSNLGRFAQRMFGWLFRFPLLNGLGESRAGPRRSAAFTGTLHFLKITFQVGNSTVAISDQDLATIIAYAQLAVQGIAEYTHQYDTSTNPVTVSTSVLEQSVSVPSGRYTNHDLQEWLNPVITSLRASGQRNFCIVICNPDGVVNTDADPSLGVYGYHLVTDTSVPYCFVNVRKTGQTIQDPGGNYATALSHEIAEMVVDPLADGSSPEICDPCEYAPWNAFFQLASNDGVLRYLGSLNGGVIQPYDFYIAAVVQPQYVNEESSPGWGCDYAPGDRQGTGQLLFHDPATGVELYSVDSSGYVALQTIQLGINLNVPSTNFALIVPGHFMARSDSDPVGQVDLLLYSRTDPNPPMEGQGQFVQTGDLGEVNDPDSAGNRPDLNVHEHGFRTTWSIIIAGKFSDNAYTDLFFYDPTVGVGQFYHTNSNGFDDYSFSSHTGFRTTWSIIIAGKFSDNAYDDLFFYDPTVGVGQFYHTTSTGLGDSFATYTGWRTTWSIIIPGKFSDSAYTDLLFYDPTVGAGEFYHTNQHGLDYAPFATYTGWRTTWSHIVALKS
ncbi:MAG: hypothetical protein ACLQUY_17700 [Ktedonobacterales bacterium]